MSGFGSVPLGQEPFQGTDGNGFVDFAAPAGCLAWVSADAAADARHGVGIARIAIGFFKTAVCNERDVAPGVGPRRARHHTRKVTVQPVAVDFLIAKSRSHGSVSSSPAAWQCFISTG